MIHERFKRGSAIGLLAVLVAASTGGCRTQLTADPTRAILSPPRPLRAATWPARRPEALVDYCEQIGLPVEPGCAKVNSFRASVEAGWLLAAPYFGGFAGFYVCRGSFGQAVVYENAMTRPARTSYRVLVNHMDVGELTESISGRDRSKPMSAGLGRWDFRLALPAGRPPRGLVLHQVSMHVSHEMPVLRKMRERGWATLTAVPEGFTSRLWRGENGIPEAVVPVGEMAATLDRYAADSAYAVEAILAHLRRCRPDIPQDPLVLMGFSLGALSAPTVATRLGDAVDAMVLVGGGANVAKIQIETALSSPAVSRLGRLLGPDALETLRAHPEGYLEQSSLDPYHTAPYLVDIPILMLHASADAIVPAETGDILWERLGRPDRWTYPYGHLLLFFFLSGEAPAIADWVEAAIGPEHGRGRSVQWPLPENIQ